MCLLLDSEYQHAHSGTLLPGGSEISAPQSLSNARSAPAGVFNQQGRSGPWSDADGSGNPCDSVYVKQYLAGYRNKQTAAGGRAAGGAAADASTADSPPDSSGGISPRGTAEIAQRLQAAALREDVNAAAALPSASAAAAKPIHSASAELGGLSVWPKNAEHVPSLHQLSELNYPLMSFYWLSALFASVDESHNCPQSFEGDCWVLHCSVVSGGAHAAAGDSAAAGSELVAGSGAGGRAVPGLPGRRLHSTVPAPRAPACHLPGGLTPVRGCIAEAAVRTPISCRRRPDMLGMASLPQIMIRSVRGRCMFSPGVFWWCVSEHLACHPLKCSDRRCC